MGTFRERDAEQGRDVELVDFVWGMAVDAARGAAALGGVGSPAGPDAESPVERQRRLAGVARELTRPIPPPFRRPPKAALSYAGLRVGVVLRLKVGGVEMAVSQVDSEGFTWGGKRYGEREWAERWEKVPKRRVGVLKGKGARAKGGKA